MPYGDKHMAMLLFCKTHDISLKITFLESLPYLPGNNEWCFAIWEQSIKEVHVIWDGIQIGSLKYIFLLFMYCQNVANLTEIEECDFIIRTTSNGHKLWWSTMEPLIWPQGLQGLGTNGLVKQWFFLIASTKLDNCMKNWNMILLYPYVKSFHQIVFRLIYFFILWFSLTHWPLEELNEI